MSSTRKPANGSRPDTPTEAPSPEPDEPEAEAESSGTETSEKQPKSNADAGERPAEAKAQSEGDSADDEPTADEALSVEMAAGRVQQPQGRGSRQRGVRAALGTLPVPEPGPSFWADLDAALADQQPLAIAARPAIRPITEPPPLSQPKLSDYLESTNVA